MLFFLFVVIGDFLMVIFWIIFDVNILNLILWLLLLEVVVRLLIEIKVNLDGKLCIFIFWFRFLLCLIVIFGICCKVFVKFCFGKFVILDVIIEFEKLILVCFKLIVFFKFFM